MSTTIYSANYCPSSISLFHDSDGYYHLIYMIVNKINNKIYIGKHSTKNPYDSYMGSGKTLKAAIKKYGLENFEKTILYCFDSEDKAYLKESEIVTADFIKREDTYNLVLGGIGYNYGKMHPNYGKPSYNKGIPMSNEQKKKFQILKKVIHHQIKVFQCQMNKRKSYQKIIGIVQAQNILCLEKDIVKNQ